MEANGAIVSRTEMCLYIWEKAPNHSYLAQLSVLVKRIKGKLKSVGIDEESLETIWEKGIVYYWKIVKKKNISIKL